MQKTLILLTFFPYFALTQPLHAADDTPSPQLMKETATSIRDAANKLAREYRTASNGKNWGLSPGHKAVYQSIFAYRNELETVTEMCTSGESPDRLLTAALDCKLKGRVMSELAAFVILPDNLLEQINAISKRSNELIAPLQRYEQRYFTWKKVDLERKHASDLARLQRELAALKINQNQIIQRSNEIAAQANCPPQQVIVVDQPQQNRTSPPVRTQPSKPVRTTRWPDPQSPHSPPTLPPTR